MFIALLSLILSGFLSSTILPGFSEAGFFLFMFYYPDYIIPALLSVTAANTLGSMTSFFITYFIPHKSFSQKTENLVKKYGAPLLFFSFMPVVGDALPLAAGWMKLPVWKSVFFICAGKFARYCAIILLFIYIN